MASSHEIIRHGDMVKLSKNDWEEVLERLLKECSASLSLSCKDQHA